MDANAYLDLILPKACADTGNLDNNLPRISRSTRDKTSGHYLETIATGMLTDNDDTSSHMAPSIPRYVYQPTVSVGYSNKGGVVFNLLRDDVGHSTDLTGLNYEFAYSRGVPTGGYTINVHLYRYKADVYPIPVTVAVSVKQSVQASAREILSTRVMLGKEGEEITAVRFRLDKDGQLVAGSVNNLPRPLRSKRVS